MKSYSYCSGVQNRHNWSTRLPVINRRPDNLLCTACQPSALGVPTSIALGPLRHMTFALHLDSPMPLHGRSLVPEIAF